MRRIDTIFVHHSASPKATTTVEDIRHWHLERGWKDIGYHFIIENDGTVQFGRPEAEIGSHTKGQNRFSIGICVVGNTNVEPPSPPQIQSLKVLCQSLFEKYNLTWKSVYGHKDFGQTECPGRMLYALLQQLKQGLG